MTTAAGDDQENAFWRELRQHPEPLRHLAAALRPFACCGVPGSCRWRCQVDELSAHLAVAEKLVRDELGKS